jgi:hypothetical protein
MARKKKRGRPKGSKNKKTSKKVGRPKGSKTRKKTSKKRGRKKSSKGLAPLAKALTAHATKVKKLATAIINEENNNLKRLK